MRTTPDTPLIVFELVLASVAVTILTTASGPLILGSVLLLLFIIAAGRLAVRAGAERARHEAGDHRFLCPGCLHFGDFQYGCGACGHKVGDIAVWSRGAYGNDCTSCNARLFDDRDGPGAGLRARCGDCGATMEARHHERKVRVLAALSSQSYAFLSAHATRNGGAADDRCAWLDDGENLVYLLDFEQARFWDEITPEHAIFSTSTLWLEGTEESPLELGERVDRLIRRMEPAGLLPQRFVVCVGRADADPAVYNLLAARFAEVRRGCDPPAFIRHGADAGVVA